jgi:transketolase
MRKTFAGLLHIQMQLNPDIFMLTADLGFGILNDIRRDFPNRAYNVGASEQLLLGAGIGLAQSGKIPVLYSITPFLLYRPFEFIRNYVSHENVPVKLVGSGRDKDYIHDGITHWADDDENVLSAFPNIIIWKPNSKEELIETFDSYLYDPSPVYINLPRSV